MDDSHSEQKKQQEVAEPSGTGPLPSLVPVACDDF
jgi:hypothetical protein